MKTPYNHIHVIINPAAGKDEAILNTLNRVFNQYGQDWSISITHQLHQHPFTDELRKLRRYVGNDVALFVGGQAAGDYLPVLQEINAKYVKNIDQFSEELNSLLPAYN